MNCEIEHRDYYVYRLDHIDGTPVYVGKWQRRSRPELGEAKRCRIALGKSGTLRKPVRVAYGPTEDEAFAEEDRLIALYGRP